MVEYFALDAYQIIWTNSILKSINSYEHIMSLQLLE